MARIALKADAKDLGRILLRTLRTAWPDGNFGEATLRSFAELAQVKGVIVACTDDATAFILTQRHNRDLWEVRFLMPFDMTADTGRALIKFAFLAEHTNRPFRPMTFDAQGNVLDKGTITVAELTRGGAGIEDATFDAYKIALATDTADVTDTTGTVRARKLTLPAQRVAERFGVTL